MSSAIFLISLGVYLHFMAPGIALEDSGELATAVGTLSLTHPPGYPLFLMVGKLFSVLPVGSPAFRLTLLSATCAALVLVVMSKIVYELSNADRLLCLAPVLSLAFVPAFIAQAVLADKYSMSLLFIASLSLLAIRLSRAQFQPLVPIVSVYGLALAHHGQSLYVAPTMLALLWQGRIWTKRRLAIVLLAFLLIGASLKLVAIPLLSIATPSLSAERLDGLARLKEYLSAAQYAERFAAFTTDQRVLRIWSAGLLSIGSQAGLLLLILAGCGGVVAWTTSRPFLLCGTAGAAMAIWLVASFQISTEGEAYYLLPVVMWLCMLASIGLKRFAGWRGGIPAWLSAVALVVRGAHAGIPYADLSRYYGAMDWGRNVLASLDRNGILVTQNDDDLFPTVYIQRVLRERQDVVLVHRPFLVRSRNMGSIEQIHKGFVPVAEGLRGSFQRVDLDTRVNMFLQAHAGQRQEALTYLANQTAARGLVLVPQGCVFRIWRETDKPRPPDAGTFASRLRRYRMRSVFILYPGISRNQNVAGSYAASWALLASLWWKAGFPGQAQACLIEAMRYPYARGVVKEDLERGIIHFMVF